MTGRLRELLESAAADGRVSMSSLTVLATQNDPFRFDTPGNHRDGAWLADTAQSLGLGTRAIHLRGLHYMVIGQPKPDGKPYTNTDADWCWLQGKAAAAARWLGYLPFDQVIDQRNDAPEIVPFVPPDLWPWVSTELDIDLPDVADLEPSVGISGFTGIQPYRVALVGEKSSLGPVLGPVADRYGADLYLPTGEASSTMVHTLARSGLDGRKVVVLYFHDCDPSGWNMPTSFGRKLQAMQASLYPDIGFEVHRVALTPDQVRAYGLPSTPLKDTEKRADKWLTAMGVQQTEIDALAALQPELLTRLAREAIRPFYDDTLAHRVDAARRDWEAAARAAVREQMAIDDAARAALASQLQAALETVREEVQRVSEQVRVDASQFDLPEPAIPGADIDDDEQPLPLVDSDWSFAEQCRSLIQDKRYGADR